MKRALWLCRWLLVLACLAALFACRTPQPILPRTPPWRKSSSEMDSAAEKFHTTEASVIWDQYQKVVDEHEEQKGKVYFRRSGE